MKPPASTTTPAEGPPRVLTKMFIDHEDNLTPTGTYSLVICGRDVSITLPADTPLHKAIHAAKILASEVLAESDPPHGTPPGVPTFAKVYWELLLPNDTAPTRPPHRLWVAHGNTAMRHRGIGSKPVYRHKVRL